MIGWIKLHRKSYDNFLYRTNKPHTRREAWEDMLLNVNFEDSSWSVGNNKIECKKGQSVMSLDSWGRIFNWDKSRVKRFFQLLIENEMILQEKLQKTTRITICNYDTYQGYRNDSDTPAKRKRNVKNTPATPIKEEEEVNKLIILDGVEWRDSLEIYLSELNAAYAELIENAEFINQQQEYNPNLNIILTLKQAVSSFWATKDGWEHKKKDKKTVVNDWQKTLSNAIKQKSNQVFKPFTIGTKTNNQAFHPATSFKTKELQHDPRF